MAPAGGGGGIGGVTGDPSERLVGGSTAERLCVMGRLGAATGWGELGV